MAISAAQAGGGAAAIPATRVQTASDPTGKADAVCPSCQNPVDSSLPFCAFCGASLSASPPKPAPAATPCKSCGAPISDASFKFCPNCAAPVAAAAPDSGTAVFSAARASVGIPVQLQLQSQDGTKGNKYALVGEETTIGRAGADIVFADDQYLSPIHAMVLWKDGKLSIRDLGSRNGTWIFLEGPHRLVDGDLVLIGSQLLRFRRLGYPGPHPPDADATRRMGSLVPSADIASLAQLRADGSVRDVFHLSPGRDVTIGRDRGDWPFPYDPSMSGSHALVRSEDADFVVLDAGSRNGVAVAARGDVQLKKGSKILVGDKILVVVMP
ncbi:MAG TPA: FHA domain-containing protein [Gemmatimonadales bacterium]|nr:FHA domain-containing protein [Gemmatimonadales bacterium]